MFLNRMVFSWLILLFFLLFFFFAPLFFCSVCCSAEPLECRSSLLFWAGCTGKFGNKTLIREHEIIGKMNGCVCNKHPLVTYCSSFKFLIEKYWLVLNKIKSMKNNFIKTIFHLQMYLFTKYL